MYQLIRHLVLLLTAVGTVVPAQALADCRCAESRRQADQAEAAPPSCCQGTTQSCCQTADSPDAQCGESCSAGGCRCLGCDGSRPEAPQISHAGGGDDLKLIGTLAYAPQPATAPASVLVSFPLAPLPPPGTPPGVRVQAALCVWII